MSIYFRHVAALVLICALPTASSAGQQTGLVTQITTRASDGLIYFQILGNAAGRPACAIAPMWWAIRDENSATGKRQLAILIAARIAGKDVAVFGSNTCARWGDIEDVEAITL